ncbi:MAG: hypothetical protein ACE14T_11210 [Syntrophales bacterium]
MIETLVGGFLGGLFRIVPEIFKWLDRKDERKHELALQDKQLAYTQAVGAQKMAEIGAENQGQFNAGFFESLKQAIASQETKIVLTGKWWIDVLTVIAHFLSQTVRPVITYWFFALYCAAKVAMFIGLVQTGIGVIESIKLIWTSEDQGLLAGILNFWFLNRVFEKAKI